MARLIDSGTLLEQIDKYLAMTLYGCTFRGGKIPPMMLEMRQAVLCDVKQLIYSAPAIDAAPVRRSEWRYVNYQIDKTSWITGEFICRKCGKSIPRHMGDNPPDYCQHGGADMRRADDDKID